MTQPFDSLRDLARSLIELGHDLERATAKAAVEAGPNNIGFPFFRRNEEPMEIEGDKEDE